MRQILATLAVLCGVGLGAGCAIDEGDDPSTDDGKSDGVGIKTVAFDDVPLASTDGRSAVLALKIPARAESFTIYIFGAGLQDEYVVDHLEGPNGEILVSDQPAGLTEEQKANVAFGAGQFHSPNRAVAQVGFASLLVPNAPRIAIAAGTWKLRVRGVRVDPQGKVTASHDAPDVKVVIKSHASTNADHRRKLKVHFYLTGSHGLTVASAARNAPFQQALRELTDLYATAGIDVKVVGMDDVDPKLQTLKATDLLAPFVRPTVDVDAVNIVVVGEFWDDRMAGFSTGIPGPVLLPSVSYRAVFMSNRPAVPYVPSTPPGLVLAHELGHYLGLPHIFDELATEIAVDPFDDTSEDAFSGNLMEPGGIDLSRTRLPIEFSPQQIELLRRSPSVR